MHRARTVFLQISGGGAGGGHHEVVSHKVELVTFLSGHVDVDLDVVADVHLFLHVVVYFRRDHGLCINLGVESLGSPGGPELIFS